MTQRSQDDHITITPKAAPLSRGASSATPDTEAPTKVLLLGAAIAALVVVGTLIFFVLPSWIDRPDVALEASTTSTSKSGESGQTDPEIVPPYRRLELERARKKAQEQLEGFVVRQKRLEEVMSIGAWGDEAYGQIKERANAADQLFLERKYDEALAEYAGAVEDLDALIADGNIRFEEALAAGIEAVNAHDVATANERLAFALAIIPDSAAARAAMHRAETLPEVMDLLRESERALLRDDVETARKYLDRVRSLDPQTAGIQTSIRELAARRAEIRYQTLLSTGFSAMDEGDYEGADRAFNEVLRMRPGDTMANAGLQQTATNRTLRRIDELRSQAESAEADGDLKRALAFYTSASKIDKTLQFASEGKRRVRKRVGIISAIDRWLNEPGVLSADDEFNKADDQLTKARAEIGAGEIYDAKVAEFAKLLQIAGSPVPLVLVSDNSTQVTIYKVGPLGSFERRELSLRPGYYTIVGSRNGCRDVRKVIMLIPDMEPIAIRCEERI